MRRKSHQEPGFSNQRNGPTLLDELLVLHVYKQSTYLYASPLTYCWAEPRECSSPCFAFHRPHPHPWIQALGLSVKIKLFHSESSIKKRGCAEAFEGMNRPQVPRDHVSFKGNHH